MDKTPQYIKECKEAWKDLQREVQLDDVVAYSFVYAGYISQGVGYYYSIADQWQSKEESHPAYLFILWKQDQLQERLDYETYELLDICSESDGIMWQALHDYATSMEQLWLAVVMKEKFQKKWDFNEKEWVRQ